jgi:hypothetical protein
MVDRHAALFHDLLEVPVAQRVGRILADADQNPTDRKAHPFEVEHIDSSWIRHRSYSTGPPVFANATEPLIPRTRLSQACAGLFE